MPELIDKREAINRIELRKQYTKEPFSVHDKTLYDHCIADIEMLPTIESGPVRHGRWIVHTTWNGMFGLIHSECSECKFDRNGDLSSWKFCPNCGARMELRTHTEAALDMADSVMMGGADNA